MPKDMTGWAGKCLSTVLYDKGTVFVANVNLQHYAWKQHGKVTQSSELFQLSGCKVLTRSEKPACTGKSTYKGASYGCHDMNPRETANRQ